MYQCVWIFCGRLIFVPYASRSGSIVLYDFDLMMRSSVRMGSGSTIVSISSSETMLSGKPSIDGIYIRMLVGMHSSLETP